MSWKEYRNRRFDQVLQKQTKKQQKPKTHLQQNATCLRDEFS